MPTLFQIALKTMYKKVPNQKFDSVLFCYFFLQVAGLNSSNIGNSSSLPANILKIRIILEKFEKNPKFLVGPTRLSPGPILFKDARSAVKLVVRS